MALYRPGFGVREVWAGPLALVQLGVGSTAGNPGPRRPARHIVPVGAADAHSAPPAERATPPRRRPTTWLYCAGGLSEQSALEAITRGRTAISDGPRGPLLWLEQDPEGRVAAHYQRAAGTALEFIADGERRHRVELPRASGAYRPPAELRFERYLRAELRVPAPKGREDVRALSAPIYR